MKITKQEKLKNKKKNWFIRIIEIIKNKVKCV